MKNKALNELTLEEKIGQLIIAGVKKDTLSKEEVELIKKYKIGNFILFTRNIKDLESLYKLNKSIYDICMKELGIIPFIAIDQEGGMVSRIMHEKALVPGQMTIAATCPSNAKEIGKMLGLELSSLGININFAPCADINSNPLNPIIGVRSYGDDPETVAEYAKEAICGMQEEGIVACAKHFPGHGDVSVDSHLGLPRKDSSVERLEEIEIYPFKETITGGVDSIMVAHIVFSEYDKTNPASLSKPIISDLLRKKLGFKGLIISDCMEMKAIDDNYTAPIGALKGIMAGLDMACICHTLEKQKMAAEKIKEAICDGLLSMEELDEKVERILSYKEKTINSLEHNFIDCGSSIKKIESIDNSISQKIVDQSLSHISGKEYIKQGKTIVFYTSPHASSIAEDEISVSDLGREIKSLDGGIDTVMYEENEFNEDYINKSLNYDTCVFVSYNAFNNLNQAKMINKLNSIHKNLFIIANRNPYDYFAIKSKSNFYTMYESTSLSNKTIAKFVSGKLSAQGKCPVKLGKRFNVSASVYIDHEEYSLQENVAYLKMLKNEEIETVFISASHVEEGKDYLSNLAKIQKEAKNIGIKLVMDINKPLMERVSIPLDVYALRLDYGYNAKEIADFISKGVRIELNGSTITKKTLDELKALGVELEGMRISHNFYPKPYTGLSQDKVLEMNKLFKQYGLNILAFIPSSNMHRAPVYEGLPTMEEHRNMNIYAVLSEMALLGIDDVCFGDAYASSSEIEIVKNFDKELTIIPMKPAVPLSEKEKNWITKIHTNRIDESPYFKRTDDRYSDKVTPQYQMDRHKKDITWDNEDFSIYNGEMCIIKEELKADKRVNVIGKALISDWLLNHIYPDAKFKIKIVDEG